jgi:predicted nuclease of predicted toxin-antitoxin system
VATFLVDENLPRSLAPRLRKVGLEVRDVRDEGLRGRPDPEILEFAVSHGLILITSDLGFGSLLRSFPSCRGLVIARLPDDWPASAIDDAVERALVRLSEQDLSASLIVIEPDRIRRRRLA